MPGKKTPPKSRITAVGIARAVRLGTPADLTAARIAHTDACCVDFAETMLRTAPSYLSPKTAAALRRLLTETSS